MEVNPSQLSSRDRFEPWPWCHQTDMRNLSIWFVSDSEGSRVCCVIPMVWPSLAPLDRPLVEIIPH
eukprot:3308712-Pyramimonas_sp.AAC.1